MLRQQIIDCINTALTQITIANGYNTDTGKQTAEWSYIDDVSPNSILQIRDIECAVLPNGSAVNAQDVQHNKRLTIQIINIWSEGVTQSGVAPRQLRLVISDVLQCINSITWPTGVYNVQLGDNSLGGQQEHRKYVGVSQTIFIDYVVPAWTD